MHCQAKPFNNIFIEYIAAVYGISIFVDLAKWQLLRSCKVVMFSHPSVTTLTN